MHNKRVSFAAVDGLKGQPLVPDMDVEELADLLMTPSLRADMMIQVTSLRTLRQSVRLRPPAGLDHQNLAKVGWGVIFGSNARQEIYDALGELLKHRRLEAGNLYREFRGIDGYRIGEKDETYETFLKRFGLTYGTPDVKKIPYYLLIVGDPEEIPYQFQYMLDAQYAVGRIHFSTPDEYAQYAQNVVRAEQKALACRPRLVLVGPHYQGDDSTEISATGLLPTLNSALRQNASTEEWLIEVWPPQQAYKSDVLSLIDGDKAPPLLFVVSHGVVFRREFALQELDQGGLLCQDWSDREIGEEHPIPNKYYVAARDISDQARLIGGICFLLGCFSAGTPRFDDFAHIQLLNWRQMIAPRAMVAELPRRLLSHPSGGMLAVIGHIDQAWSHSFASSNGTNVQSFADTLIELMAGNRVGFAMEAINTRFAEIAVSLTTELEELHFGKERDSERLINLWISHNDARGYVVVGDPAVRLVFDKMVE